MEAMKTISVYVLLRKVFSSAFHGENVVMEITKDADHASEWIKHPNQYYVQKELKID